MERTPAAVELSELGAGSSPPTSATYTTTITVRPTGTPAPRPEGSLQPPLFEGPSTHLSLDVGAQLDFYRKVAASFDPPLPPREYLLANAYLKSTLTLLAQEAVGQFNATM